MVAATVAVASAAPASAGIWSAVDSGLGASPPDTITAIDYQSDSRFWFATSVGNIRYRVGGAFQPAAFASSNAGIVFNDIAFKPGGTIGIAVGSNGNVWRSTDSGANWSKLTISTYDLNCGFSASPTVPTTGNPGAMLSVAWGSGGRVYIGGEKSTLLFSNTDGASFVEQNKSVVAESGGQRVQCKLDDNPADIVPLAVPDGTADSSRPLYVVGSVGYVYFTADGLASTASKRAPVACQPARALVVDPGNVNRLWGLGPGTCLYPSADGGATYGSCACVNVRNAGGEAVNDLQDVAGGGQLTLIAVGRAGQIMQSTNGVDWYYNDADSPFAATDWHAVSGFDATNFAVGGVGGALVVTAQGSTLPPPPPSPPPPPPPPDTEAPTGTADGPARPVLGTPATYTANLTDTGGSGIDPAGTAWSVAGLPGAAGQAATFTFLRAGAQTIQLAFRDFAGNAGSATKSVTVAKAVPKLSAALKPKKDVTAPFAFVVSGRLSLPTGVTAALGCNGKTKVTFKAGKKTVASKSAKVDKKCKYTARFSITNRAKFPLASKLKVAAAFGGNAALATATRSAGSATVR